MAENPRTAELAHSPQAPSQARRAVGDWLAGRLDGGRLENVKLLVSELVTNAVRHPGADGAVGLEVAMAGSRVRVVVTDPGDGFARPGTITAPPPEAEGGRGLLIVDRVASRWGVTPGPPTAVWFELD